MREGHHDHPPWADDRVGFIVDSRYDQVFSAQPDSPPVVMKANAHHRSHGFVVLDVNVVSGIRMATT
jgi:hypothetical protein